MKTFKPDKETSIIYVQQHGIYPTGLFKFSKEYVELIFQGSEDFYRSFGYVMNAINWTQDGQVYECLIQNIINKYQTGIANETIEEGDAINIDEHGRYVKASSSERIK